MAKTNTFTALNVAIAYAETLQEEATTKRALKVRPSAAKRTVYRVVKLTGTKRAKYLVCATPWAYRLQQQGRGEVIAIEREAA